MDSTITNTTDTAGNTEVRSGHFEWSNGSSSTVADYNLQTNVADTIAAKELAVPSDIAALPDLLGHGNIYSLHQAMVRDYSGQLKALVEEFASDGSRINRETIFGQIVLKWTGSENPSGIGFINYDGRKLSVLEKYYGQSLISNQSVSTGTFSASSGSGSGSSGGSGSAVLLPSLTYETVVAFNKSYHEIFEGYYGALMSQTHLKDLYDKITCTWDMEKQEYKNDLSGVAAEIQASLANDPEQGKELLSEFARTWRGLNNGGWATADYLSFRETFIEQYPALGWVIDTGGLPVFDHVGQGLFPSSNHMNGTDNSDAVRGSLTEGDGCINGLNGNDVIYGTDRNEVLFNETGDALLVAGGGNDNIYAGAGNDILDGGAGNDLLYGETGDDTYIFRKGSGQDTIRDFDSTAGNTDTIWLGGNLTADDVSLRRVGYNLVLKIKDTTDTLTVTDYFRNDSTLNTIEQIVFMDGTTWGESDILEKTFVATEGDDILYRGDGNDTVSGLGGNDFIYGRGGDDVLHDDDTYLFAGPPVLFGGSPEGSSGVYLKTGLRACA